MSKGAKFMNEALLTGRYRGTRTDAILDEGWAARRQAEQDAAQERFDAEVDFRQVVPGTRRGVDLLRSPRGPGRQLSPNDLLRLAMEESDRRSKSAVRVPALAVRS